jgi:hypothetical protein
LWDASRELADMGLPGHSRPFANPKKSPPSCVDRLSSVHLLLSDKWGWGKTGFYTAAQGFISLQSPQALIESTTLWKQVWDPLGLPKINFFCWVLMHRKVLTGENLAKRGIIGPHRCSMCCNALEMMDHLFVDCPFAQEVWKISLQDLNVRVPNRLQWLPYSPPGRRAILKRFKAVQFGKEFGRPSPNTFAGNYGCPEMNRSSTTLFLPPNGGC